MEPKPVVMGPQKTSVGTAPRKEWGRLSKAVPRNILIFISIGMVAAFAIWFLVPVYLRDYLNKRGQELPDYVCHIDSVYLDLLPCGINLYGVTLVKRSGHIPVPFFTSPHIRIVLQWREILHGCLRSNVTLEQPIVNFVQGPSQDQSQTFLEPTWVQEVEQLVPLQINRFEVCEGDIHYYEFNASPRIDLEMDQVEVILDNLTNSVKKAGEFPNTAFLSGRPFKRGKLEVTMAMNVDIKQPTFKDQIRLQNIPAPALNAFLAKYASVYAKSGDLAFYSEMVSEKGRFDGYLKPFFQNLQFEPMPKDREGLAAVWATLMNGIKDVFENQDNTIATQIPVSGNYEAPYFDFWSAAFGIIKNAYFEALAQGFQKPELAHVAEKPVP